MSYNGYDVKFQAEVLEAILSSISEKLGKDVAHVVLFSFSSQTRLEKEDVVRNAEAFEDALNGLFGSGSHVVLDIIISGIERRFQLKESTIESIHLREVIDRAWRARQNE